MSESLPRTFDVAGAATAAAPAFGAPSGLQLARLFARFRFLLDAIVLIFDR